MSRHNRPAQTPPKAPEPKAADASAPAVPPAENDLQAQIAAQMAAAEASRGAVGAVEGADSSIQVTEPSNDPEDASPDVEDAEEGDETVGAPDASSEPSAPGNLVTLHVSPNIDPTLAEAFGATPKAPEPKAARFKVWQHGSLQCDGTTYLPGEALPFSAARIAALGIQHLAVPIEN